MLKGTQNVQKINTISNLTSSYHKTNLFSFTFPFLFLSSCKTNKIEIIEVLNFTYELWVYDCNLLSNYTNMQDAGVSQRFDALTFSLYWKT